MIKPKLTKEQVQKALETACENCKHFEECEDGFYEKDQFSICLFFKYYSRILQEFK